MPGLGSENQTLAAIIVNSTDVDPVTQLLENLYLPRWLATEFSVTGRWGYRVPAEVACMHVVIQGRGWLECDDQNTVPIRITSGDHVIIPRGMSHRVLSKPGAPTEPIGERLVDPPWFFSADHHNDRTSILYGQFDLSYLNRSPLDAGMPEIIHLNHHRDDELASCIPVLRLLNSTRREAGTGWLLTVRRLAELIFVKTIGVQMTRGMPMPTTNGDGNVGRMMRAATDSLIGSVLREIIQTPEAPWTVPQMAKNARIAKSTFSERFRKLVGQPPLQYLTEVRMHRACQMLLESRADISDIARLVGYESPSSFSNAFRRWRGMSPAAYRREGSNAKW